LDLNYYWELTPKQFLKHIRVFNEKEEARVKEVDSLNFLLGKYIAFAINEPKKYPKEPFLSKKTGRIMKAEEMEEMAKRITKKTGGEII
jgi:hypothetical protein